MFILYDPSVSVHAKCLTVRWLVFMFILDGPAVSVHVTCLTIRRLVFTISV